MISPCSKTAPRPRRGVHLPRPGLAPTLLLGAALAGCAGTAPPDPTRPVKPPAPVDVGDKITGRFLGSAAQGNLDDAYGQLCASYRRRLSIEEFSRALQAQPVLTTGSMVSLVRTEVHADGSLVRRGSLDAASGRTPIEVFLSQEGGGWCLTGLSLGGKPVLPGGTTT